MKKRAVEKFCNRKGVRLKKRVVEKACNRKGVCSKKRALKGLRFKGESSKRACAPKGSAIEIACDQQSVVFGVF